MSTMLSDVKQLNNQSLKKAGKRLLRLELLMITLAVVLLAVNTDAYMTIGVLLIFFAFVMFIITLFLIALNAEKNKRIKVNNTIKTVYRQYIESYNLNHDSQYLYDTESASNTPWFILPSYASKDIYYCLKDQSNSKMYHAAVYSSTGSPPRRTYFFKGLYIIINGIDGDIQYRDNDTISSTVINTLKFVYGSDAHDLKRYANKMPYESGMFYSQNEEKMPMILKKLIDYLKQSPVIQSIKIAVRSNQLHLAIEYKETQLPYIRKYQDMELDSIKKHVEAEATLLSTIQKITKEQLT